MMWLTSRAVNRPLGSGILELHSTPKLAQYFDDILRVKHEPVLASLAVVTGLCFNHVS